MPGYSSHACPGASAKRLIVSSEGWSWITSTLLPGTTIASTALLASAESSVATIQISKVRPPVDADRAASTRTKNASAILLMWDGLRLAANSTGHVSWSHLRPNTGILSDTSDAFPDWTRASAPYMVAQRNRAKPRLASKPAWTEFSAIESANG